MADQHTHPFDVKAHVVPSELWLTVGGATKHLRVGDRLELTRDIACGERNRPEGATYWVAR